MPKENSIGEKENIRKLWWCPAMILNSFRQICKIFNPRMFELKTNGRYIYIFKSPLLFTICADFSVSFSHLWRWRKLNGNRGITSGKICVDKVGAPSSRQRKWGSFRKLRDLLPPPHHFFDRGGEKSPWKTPHLDHWAWALFINCCGWL